MLDRPKSNESGHLNVGICWSAFICAHQTSEQDYTVRQSGQAGHENKAAYP